MSGNRETREFWTSVDGMVRRAPGLTCAPDNPGVWWFPTVGYSLTEGSGCFCSETDARVKAREWIATQRQRLDRLEAELSAGARS